MKNINGLVGIGTNGPRGKKGNRGISTITFNNKAEENVNYPYLYIDDKLNMRYINNSFSKDIYVSNFYDIDKFNLKEENIKKNIYSKYNLLYQKNIFSNKHRENIAADIDSKLFLLNDVKDASVNFLSLKTKDSSTLNFIYNKDKDYFYIKGDSSVYLDSSNNSYFFSNEQVVLKYINNNLINLIYATYNTMYESGKKYIFFSFDFKEMYNYLLSVYTEEDIKKNLRIEFIKNDNMPFKTSMTTKKEFLPYGEEVAIKKFNEELKEGYNCSYICNYKEYEFSYYLKIYLKNNIGNIFLLYCYITKDERLAPKYFNPNEYIIINSNSVLKPSDTSVTIRPKSYYDSSLTISDDKKDYDDNNIYSDANVGGGSIGAGTGGFIYDSINGDLLNGGHSNNIGAKPGGYRPLIETNNDSIIIPTYSDYTQEVKM